MTLTDLTEFLHARIAEDEANAGRYVEVFPEGDMAPLFRRVLAECEAKRARLRLADDIEGEADDDTYTWAVSVANRIRRIEALLYADHPEFREEWRP